MQNQTNRLQWRVLLVVSRVVGVGIFMVLCFAALSSIMFHGTSPANAASTSLRKITGSISSSPSSGPVGTTIYVSGSGWGGTDGTPVSFGYQVNSGCSIVADSQTVSLRSGSFSGWFRWPSGTALNTFHVCAMLGNVMEVAGSFTVLSSSPPSVSIYPSTLAPNTHATITASNYYPAGTQVNFLWMSGNTVVENLNSVTSNTSGVAILTFTVPNFSIASGSYSINATSGGGQPAALSSSTNFIYNAPVVPPTPTPNPSPSPSPTPSPSPSPMPSPTTTPGATPTVTATATTGATPTVGASPTVLSSQTTASNGTTPGNGSNTTGSGSKMLLVGGVAVLLIALLVGLVAVFLIGRQRKAARALATVIPPIMPYSPAHASWANPQSTFMNNGAMPPPLNHGMQANYGQPGHPNAASFAPYNLVSGPDMFPRQASDMPPTVQSASIPVGAGAVTGNGNAIIAVPVDPSLDAMRRQAQSGLFVTPRPFKDERSQ